MKLKAFLKKRGPHTYPAHENLPHGGSGLLYHTQGMQAGYLGDSPRKFRLEIANFRFPLNWDWDSSASHRTAVEGSGVGSRHRGISLSRCNWRGIVSILRINLEARAVHQDFDAAIGGRGGHFWTRRIVTQGVLIAGVAHDVGVHILDGAAGKLVINGRAAGGGNVFGKDVGVAFFW